MTVAKSAMMMIGSNLSFLRRDFSHFWPRRSVMWREIPSCLRLLDFTLRQFVSTLQNQTPLIAHWAKDERADIWERWGGRGKHYCCCCCWRNFNWIELEFLPFIDWVEQGGGGGNHHHIVGAPFSSIWPSYSDLPISGSWLLNVRSVLLRCQLWSLCDAELIK